MPHPEGAKMLYISPEVMKNFTELTSQVLRVVLENISIWSEHITVDDYFDKVVAAIPKLRDCLKKLKLI